MKKEIRLFSIILIVYSIIMFVIFTYTLYKLDNLNLPVLIGANMCISAFIGSIRFLYVSRRFKEDKEAEH